MSDLGMSDLGMNDLHPAINRVTNRIIEKSKKGRTAYLDHIAREGEAGINRAQLSCGVKSEFVRS